MEAPKDAVSKLSLSEGVDWSRRDLPRFPQPLGVLVRRAFRSGLAVAERLSVLLCCPGAGEGSSLPRGSRSPVATRGSQEVRGLLCSSFQGPGLLKTPAVSGVDSWTPGSPSVLYFINDLCPRCSSLARGVHVADAEVRGGWLP